MSRHTYFLALAVGFVGLAGLAPAAPIPIHLMPKEQAFSYPSFPGTKMVYEVNGKDETWVITKAEEKDGGTLVTIETETANGQMVPRQKILVKEGGLFLAQESGQDYDKPWCICKLPHRDGQTWDASFSRKGPVTPGTMRSVALEEIAVPAGKFSCSRVEWDFNGSKVIYWYASGVGLVQMGDPAWRKLKRITPGKG